MSALVLFLAGTASTLVTAVITGALAVTGSVLIAYFAMRTTLRTSGNTTARDITTAVVADGKNIRDELWKRFEESDTRERKLNERIDKAEDENRDCRWQIDRLKTEYAIERVSLLSEIDRLKGQVSALLAEVGRLQGER